MRLVRATGQSINRTAQDLGVCHETLRHSVKQTKIDADEAEGPTCEARPDLARLRRENRLLREEREILKEDCGFLRPEDRSAAMKYRLIDAQKPHHAVSRLACALAVSRSGHHACKHRRPSARSLADAHAICEGKKRVARLMCPLGNKSPVNYELAAATATS